MSAATHEGVPAPPWAPDLRVVRYALGLRSGWVALTKLSPGRDGRLWGSARAFHLPGEVDQAVQWVQDNAGPDNVLTWTLADLLPEGAERINSSDRPTVAHEGDVAGYGWVAADLDPSEGVSRDDYRQRLSTFDRPPSLVLDSGRGLHVFWRLEQWVSAANATPTLVDLVRYFDCDPATVDRNRNLRLPGTWNGKAEARKLTAVEAFDWELRYTPAQLSERAYELSPRPEPRAVQRRERRVLAEGDDWPAAYRDAYELADELERIAGPPLGRGAGRKWPCPAGHAGDGPPSLTLHPDNEQRAVCHGGTHPSDMGRPSGSRMSFDVIDLHAMEAGQTVETFMADERRRQKPAGNAAPTTEEPEAQQSEEWRDRVPLTSSPAAIPVDGLPPVFAQMVRAAAANAQAPVEIPLVFALGAVSAATRGCWNVDIYPGWGGEPTSVYAVALARSGERKSAGKGAITAALDEAEKRVASLVKAANRERELRRKGAEARRKKVPEDEDAALKEAAIIHENRPRPVPALVLSDTTTEALGVHMEEQGGAAALMNVEATAFRTVAGAYSDNGGNVGLLNQAYGAERYVDRRIKRAGVTIHRPFLAWAAAVQPEALTGYANATTEGSGFLGRFLLLLPASMVGTRIGRGTEVPAAVQQAWDDALTALHSRAWDHYARMTDDPDDFGKPLVIALSDEAAVLLESYKDRIEAGKLDNPDLRDLGGWIEKHPARLARIAALFALLQDPYASRVQESHVRSALTLADPFVEHATAAMRVLRNQTEAGPVRRVLEALRSIGQTSVTTREVYRQVKSQGWVERAVDVRAVLAELADLDYLRPEKVSTGGRPSEVWHVHPSVVPAGTDAPEPASRVSRQ